MSEGQPRHMEFAVVVGPFINDVVSKSEMFDNHSHFAIYFSVVDPFPPLFNEVVYGWPFGYKTKSSNRVWTLLAVVFVVLSDSFVSTQAITHKKRPRCYFQDFFFYVGMRTFSMVLLPVNLDHGGIGTFKGLGFRDLLLGPVNFRDPFKGQLNSEWIYEVIVSSKIPTKNYRDFCPGSLLEGRAEISVIFGW